MGEYGLSRAGLASVLNTLTLHVLSRCGPNYPSALYVSAPFVPALCVFT